MIIDWFLQKTRGKRPPAEETIPSPDSAQVAVPAGQRELLDEERHGLYLSDAYTAEERAALRADFYPAGSWLFLHGEAVDRLYYLLQGTIGLKPLQGHAPRISAGTREAVFPLCGGAHHVMSAYAQTDVWVLRAPLRTMENRVPEPDALLDFAELSARYPSLKDDHLFYVFIKAANESDLSLPVMPHLVQRVRTALQEGNDLVKAAQIMQAEPVMAAKVIEIANSPAFRTIQPVNSCLHAMTLLGVEITANILTGLCLKSFYTAQKAQVRDRMQQLWQQSIFISALAFELAGHIRGANPDKALLGGLFSHLGTLPFLKFVDEYPGGAEYPGDISAALDAVKGPLGSRLLRNWGFSPDLAAVPLHIGNWFHSDPGPGITQAEIAILAHWHSHIGRPTFAELPPLTALPAYAKLNDGELDPKDTLNILAKARDEVDRLCRLLA